MSTVSEEVIVDRLGSVTTIGINRPEKRNCVNIETGRKLSQAIANFEEDPSSRAAVLHGIGGNFCAGFDLSELSKLETFPNILPGDGFMGPTRRFFKKPIIAAVSGYAVAGGMELALMCDLRVMEETAIMGVFCRRFGVPLLDGGTVRLQAMVGLSRALDLVLTGRPINAKEALDFGIANRLVACGTALGQAVKLADSLEKFPPECLLADRESVFYSAYSAKNYDDALNFEAENGQKVLIKESVQGAQKFVTGIGRHGSFQKL